MIQRLARDESGMTMGLAIMMILLISVMGAGLLTFVSRDLNSVIEENRGQKAFEVADAGIEAAKRQLASDVVTEDYDGEAPDIQWSLLNEGLILRDLDDMDSTTDQATVTIEYMGEEADDFKVISTGTYGDPPRQAKRKIEALFTRNEAPIGPGDGLGHPLYYTPSDIKIEHQVQMNAMSLFTEQDILLQGGSGSVYDGGADGWVDDRAQFRNDMRVRNDGTTQISGTADELCNWDTDTPITLPDETEPCYPEPWVPWNTEGRTQDPAIYPNHTATTTTPWVEGGLAAEGLICGVPAAIWSSTNSCTPTFDSVADGVYGYDCTTGPVIPAGCPPTDANRTRGNALTFVDKEEMLGPGGAEESNPDNTISYPFPIPIPNPAALKQLAQNPLPANQCDLDASTGTRDCYHEGVPTQANWAQLFPGGEANKLVFVDALNSPFPLNFNTGNANSTRHGILVVWCGDLVQQQRFNGIILSLNGPSFDGEASSCGPDKGLYTNAGGGGASAECKCWVYAKGGTATRAGILLKAGSKSFYPTNRDWAFLENAIVTENPSDSFGIQRWRERYD